MTCRRGLSRLRSSGRTVGRIDARGEAIEIGHGWFVFPHVEPGELICIHVALTWSHHGSDRHLRPGDLVITLQDRTVLGSVEVEGEHDPVGILDHFAAGAGEQRAQPFVSGAMAHDDLVARALQEGAIELGATPR